MVSPNATSSAPSVSDAKRRANRRNARKSTGPRTEEGKRRSSRNATTHGIFCRDLVLPGEDRNLFRMTRNSFIRDLKVHGAAQLALVDAMVSARGRLNRCQAAEAQLIAERMEKTMSAVTKRLETLDQNFKFADFSSVALNAACEENEVLDKYHKQWRELRAMEADGLAAASAMAAIFSGEQNDQPLERLSRYEQRLHGQFHRCLRDLDALKKRAKEYADEPESEFLEEWESQDDDDGDGDAPSDPSGGVGVPPERAGGATEGEKTLREDAQATEEGTEDVAQEAVVQNEPTAPEPAASAATAGGCGERRREVPDPEEMARLRKLAERASRCRPDPVFGPF